MKTQTATRILDAIAAGRIYSLNDARIVGIGRRQLSNYLRQLREVGVEIVTNKGCAPGVELKAWRVRRWGPFARRRK